MRFRRDSITSTISALRIWWHGLHVHWWRWGDRVVITAYIPWGWLGWRRHFIQYWVPSVALGTWPIHGEIGWGQGQFLVCTSRRRGQIYDAHHQGRWRVWPLDGGQLRVPQAWGHSCRTAVYACAVSRQCRGGEPWLTNGQHCPYICGLHDHIWWAGSLRSRADMTTPGRGVMSWGNKLKISCHNTQCHHPGSCKGNIAVSHLDHDQPGLHHDMFHTQSKWWGTLSQVYLLWPGKYFLRQTELNWTALQWECHHHHSRCHPAAHQWPLWLAPGRLGWAVGKEL